MSVYHKYSIFVVYRAPFHIPGLTDVNMTVYTSSGIVVSSNTMTDQGGGFYEMFFTPTNTGSFLAVVSCPTTGDKAAKSYIVDMSPNKVTQFYYAPPYFRSGLTPTFTVHDRRNDLTTEIGVMSEVASSGVYVGNLNDVSTPKFLYVEDGFSIEPVIGHVYLNHLVQYPNNPQRVTSVVGGGGGGYIVPNIDAAFLYSEIEREEKRIKVSADHLSSGKVHVRVKR